MTNEELHDMRDLLRQIEDASRQAQADIVNMRQGLKVAKRPQVEVANPRMLLNNPPPTTQAGQAMQVSENAGKHLGVMVEMITKGAEQLKTLTGA
jgi:hypothetical protein